MKSINVVRGLKILVHPKMVIWLFLLQVAKIAVQVHAQSSQAGFISIDCGIASNTTYVDQVTSITYVSDDQYIDTGSISNIDPNYKTSSLPSQFLNLRSFPEHERNCYMVPVVQYQRYLVRARFMYGNYDGKNKASADKPLQFELHLGVNMWSTVSIPDASYFHSFEALTLATANFTSICLINTGNGDPFISALELRPLSMYDISQSDLKRFFRYNYGELSYRILRFPDDPYDRIWYPPPEIAGTTTVSTSSIINSGSGGFHVPSAVLQTAIKPTNSMILTFVNFDADSVDEEFYYILHFAEVERLTGNSTRIFDIYRDDERTLANYTPPYSSANSVNSAAPFRGATRYRYSLNATSDSTLPPIINAMEIYSVIKVTAVPTDLYDVYSINTIKKQYLVKRNWAGDPCSPSKYIWDGLNCRYDRDSSRITSLNLSSNGLIGVISPSFAGLTNLMYLDLSNNNLTGVIPDSLGNMPSLKVLILSCNNLTGPIPASLSQRASDGQIIVRFDNTANACEKFLKSSGNSSKGKISKSIVAVVLVVSAVLLLLVVAFIVWRIKKVRALGSNSAMPPAYLVPPHRGDRLQRKSDHIVDHQIQTEMKQFSYKEVAYVTRNFESIIGKGGFGVVYRGTLHDGKQVAVKMLSHTSTQGTKEFLAEAQNLARIHHRNLVSLVGYCMDGSYLGLVYEYMAKGNLREHLKEHAGQKTLMWVERLRIAVESAQGLEYLHKGCNPPIIHRDVKTTNILLNNDMEAKLADFGLSKAFHNDRHRSHISTQAIVGTPGYVDPEYQSCLLLNEKSDVYSFGVVLMELVSGQSHILPGNVHISQRVVQSIERGSIDDIVDKRLDGEYDANSAWKIVDLSLKCTAPRGSQRPSMSEVVMQLKESLDLAHMTPTTGNSEKYNSVVYVTPSAR